MFITTSPWRVQAPSGAVPVPWLRVPPGPPALPPPVQGGVPPGPLALHQVALLPQEVDLQALLLLQHMEGMTSGIAGGIHTQVLQHLKYKILEVAMNLQLTNSRPWDG